MTPSRFVASALALCITVPVLAQQIQIPDWESSVQFQFVTSQEPVRPGDEFQVAVLVDIEDGYHLYGPEEQEPSRTQVAVSGDNVEVGEPSFPPVVTRELEGLGTYDLYEGRIAVKVPVRVSASTGADEHTLRATVNYQVCTDFACSAPTSDELSLSIPGGTADTEVARKFPEIFEQK